MLPNDFWLNLAVMAGVTYLVRMLPLALFKRKIENVFIQSFLYYVPYAVLGAMTFPAILSSTGSIWSAVAGLAVAVLLAFYEKRLLTVALWAGGTVLATEFLLRFLPL